ncbi:MAG: hypothetical protein NVSMB52_07670 [Chloroflexota bacterium]
MEKPEQPDLELEFSRHEEEWEYLVSYNDRRFSIVIHLDVEPDKEYEWSVTDTVTVSRHPNETGSEDVVYSETPPSSYDEALEQAKQAIRTWQPALLKTRVQTPRELTRTATQEFGGLIESMHGLSFDELLQILENGSIDEKRAAAVNLGDLGDRRAVDVLLRVAETTESYEVRMGAAYGLFELADPKTFDPLLAQIHRLRREGGVYEALIWALEPLNPRSALVDFVQFICEDDYISALMSLGVIQELRGPIGDDDLKRAVSLLRKGLEETEWRRSMMENALAELERLRRNEPPVDLDED